MPKVLQLLECSIGLYWFGQYLKYACIKTDVHSRVGYTMLHIAKNKGSPYETIFSNKKSRCYLSFP